MMNRPCLSIIAAIDSERAIGKDGRLPWHLPEDLKRFKRLTVGRPIIMGRKTFASIGRPLPGRINIVISWQDLTIPNVIIVNSLPEAIKQAKTVTKTEIFIIGGSEIYRQAMPVADKIYLTIIDGNFGGDTFFPDYTEFKQVVKQEKHSDGKYDYTFLELTK